MKIFALLLFFFLAAVARPQNSKIDSLNILINKAGSDTQRINLVLNKLAILTSINLDSVIILANQTLQSAQKINFYKGEFHLRCRLAMTYCFKGAYAEATEQLNYLEHFTKPSKDSLDFAEFYSAKGLFYGTQSRYDSSIIWYEKAIRIFERAENKSELPGAYSNIAIAYQQQSNFPQALVYQQKALHLAQENHNEVSQAYTLMNIGNTYQGLGDSVRAEQFILKAIEIAKRKSLVNVELYGYSNLASLYIKQNKWQQAYDFSLKSAMLGGSMGDHGIEAAGMSKAATALSYLNKLPQAEVLAKRAIEIADSSAQPLNIYQAYSSMGGIQRLKGNFAAAIQYFEKGFFSIKGSDTYTIDDAENYKQLSQCYEKTGSYGKALENYKIAAVIIDSARRKDNIQKATELTMTYEFDKKQVVAKAEQDKKDADAKRLKNQQFFTILALGTIVLAVAIIALIQFRSNKHKKNANIALQQQKKKVEIAFTELKTTQAQLIQSEKMALLGELTAGIAHEIQNPLNFVNNFSEVNKDLLGEMNEEIKKGNLEAVEAIVKDILDNEEKINHHGKRADAIVKGMLQHSRASTGHKEPTDINKLVDEYLRLSYHGLRAKDRSFNADFTTDFDNSIGKINIIPQDLGRVLLNLYNNAFYAVNEKKKVAPDNYKPIVSITTKRISSPPAGGDGGIEIRVTDNGNGIPHNIVAKIFQPFFTTKPSGQGTGLGLSLSYDIVKAHGGEIKIDTREGDGSEFVIQLPMS